MNHRYAPLPASQPQEAPTQARVQCACGIFFKVEPDKETYCSVRCARADAWRTLNAGRSHYRLLKHLDFQEKVAAIPPLPPFPSTVPKSKPAANKDKALPPLPQEPDMHVVQVPSNSDLRRALPPLQIPHASATEWTACPTPRTLRRVSSMVAIRGVADAHERDWPKRSNSDKQAERPKRRQPPARLWLEVASLTESLPSIADPTGLLPSIEISSPPRQEPKPIGREPSMDSGWTFPSRAAESPANVTHLVPRSTTLQPQGPAPSQASWRPVHGRKRSSSFGTYDRNLRVDVPQDVRPDSISDIDEGDVWAAVQYLRITTSEYLESPSVYSAQGSPVYSQSSPIVPDLTQDDHPDTTRVPQSPPSPDLGWTPKTKKSDRLVPVSQWFD